MLYNAILSLLLVVGVLVVMGSSSSSILMFVFYLYFKCNSHSLGLCIAFYLIILILHLLLVNSFRPHVVKFCFPACWTGTAGSFQASGSHKEVMVVLEGQWKHLFGRPLR